MPDSDFPPPPAGRSGWPWFPTERPLRSRTDPPRITIVTPSYNQGEFLEETIRSVLLQGYPNLEYLVVDGGSTDGSLDVIRRYEPWITWWTSEPDRGQADAINKGFERATGSILGWLNSDDVLYPGFLDTRIDQFEAMPEADLIYGDVEVGADVSGPRTIMEGRSIDFASMVETLDVPIPQQSALWRRSLLDRAGSLDPRWQVVLDRDFFLRAARHGTLAYRPGPTGLFRLHEASKSEASQLAWVEELPELYAEFFADPTLPPAVAALKDRSTVALERLNSRLLWRHRRFRGWAGCLVRAAGTDLPTFLRLFVLDTARSKIRGARRRIDAILASDRTNG